MRQKHTLHTVTNHPDFHGTVPENVLKIPCSQTGFKCPSMCQLNELFSLLNSKWQQHLPTTLRACSTLHAQWKPSEKGTIFRLQIRCCSFESKDVYQLGLITQRFLFYILKPTRTRANSVTYN